MEERALRSLIERTLELDDDDAAIDLRRTIKPTDTASGTASLDADPSAVTIDLSGGSKSGGEAVGEEAPPDLRIGFELGEELGRGGMNVIYRAHQLDLDREIAVKRLLPSRTRKRSARWAFLSEAMVTGKLEHPNVVPVHGLSVDADGGISLAMKLVGGRTWSSQLEADRARESPPSLGSLEQNLVILESVMNAVAFAHSRGVLHRDLKPENVMIGEFGEVILMDWGLAVRFCDEHRGIEAPHRSTVRRITGTPVYMAPEMVETRCEELGPCTDVYLLGGILHEILTGRPPHVGKSLVDVLVAASLSAPPTFPPGTPEEIQSICRRALARDPADRFESVAELRDAIQAYRGHRHSSAISDRESVRLDECRKAVETGVDAANRADLYGELTEVIAGFAQARFLWPENPIAAKGEIEARLLLARAALRMGDLGAAQSALRSVPARQGADLAAEVDASIAARSRTLRTTRRVGMALLVLQLLVAGALSFYAYRALHVFQIEEIFEVLRIFTPVAGDAMRAAGPDDPAELGRIVRRITAGRQLRLTVIAPDGTVLAESKREPSEIGNRGDRPEILDAQRHGEGLSIRPSETLGEDMMFYAVPVKNADGRTSMYVRAALPVESIDAQLKPLVIVVGAGLVVSLLVSMSVTVLLARHLRRAIQRVT